MQVRSKLDFNSLFPGYAPGKSADGDEGEGGPLSVALEFLRTRMIAAMDYPGPLPDWLASPDSLAAHFQAMFEAFELQSADDDDDEAGDQMSIAAGDESAAESGSGSLSEASDSGQAESSAEITWGDIFDFGQNPQAESLALLPIASPFTPDWVDLPIHVG